MEFIFDQVYKNQHAKGEESTYEEIGKSACTKVQAKIGIEYAFLFIDFRLVYNILHQIQQPMPKQRIQTVTNFQQWE